MCVGGNQQQRFPGPCEASILAGEILKGNTFKMYILFSIPLGKIGCSRKDRTE